MRILQVTPAFPPSAYGGVSTHVSLISKGLAGLGHTVWVATTNRYDLKHVMTFSGLREADGLRIYYARAYWPGRYSIAPSILRVLNEWIPACDIVHIHDTRTFVGLAAYLIAKNSTVPYVVTCHGSLSVQVGDTALKMIHDRVLGRGLVENASRVIAVTEKEVDDITAFGIPPERIILVPNALPIEEAMLHDGQAGRSTRSRAERTILYLGRIHPIKGIDRLVEAFGVVHKSNGAARLLIVGQDYGARPQLEKIVRKLGLESKVEFKGPVYGEPKKALLFGADVLVLPSYSEIFGLVVLEAFASGLPVIATNACSIADDLESAHAGLIVSSVPEMADAIERCLTDDALADQLRQGGLTLLRTKYNWQATLAKLEFAYDQSKKSG